MQVAGGLFVTEQGGYVAVSSHYSSLLRDVVIFVSRREQANQRALHRATVLGERGHYIEQLCRGSPSRSSSHKLPLFHSNFHYFISKSFIKCGNIRQSSCVVALFNPRVM